MKTKLILAALLVVSLNVKAQVARLGIMGGLSSETLQLSNVPDGASGLVKGNGIVGGEAGLFLKADILPPFYIKPEVLIHFGSGTVLEENADNPNDDMSFSYTKAEIPLLIGLRLLGPVSIQGGPAYDYIIYTSNLSSQGMKVNPSGIGYRVGGEVQMTDNVLFDLSLEGENHNTALSEAAFRVPYAIVADIGFTFGAK